jgi:glyoxylase-like metal-dependent hydrolase (beta-lactamase superfamily II)
VVAPGVRRVTAPNGGPFTFRGTNTYLIGARELAVLDPGPADPAHIAALLAAIGGARVRHILVSHTHRDHSPAARLLQAETGAPILAEGPHRPARPHHAGETTADAAADRDFRPDEALADGAVVETGDYRIETVATPGHTANHLAFALADRGILFSGDHVMGWSTTIVAPPDGSMRDYMASLDRLLDRPEALYLPGHGGAVSDAHAFVRAIRTHRKLREAAILNRIEAGDRTVAEVAARVYAGLSPHLAGAARLSRLAHLEDLIDSGLVEADTAPSLASRYWPAGESG